MLAGPRGLGKRAFACVLAQGILCRSPQPDGEPCGVCASCHLFESRSHPDFRLVEPADDEPATEPALGGTPGLRGPRVIMVSQVRALADFLAITSHLGGAKVVLIQPADRMHISAANALLKTLEEPMPGTVFLLVADRPHRLPPTVRSRCFRIDFQIPPRDMALDWLAAKRTIDPEVALAQAGFAPLAAERLGQGGYWDRRRALNELLVSPPKDPGDLAAQMDTEEMPTMYHLLYRWCHDLVSARIAGRVRYNPDCAENLLRLADNADVLELDSLAKELIAALRALDHPLNPRLVIEQLAIRYTRMMARQPS